MFSTLFLLGVTAQAKTEFWCEPLDQDTNIEAVLATQEDGMMQIGVYTTSKTWGAVDERLAQAERSEANGVVVYKSEKDILTVDTQSLDGVFSSEINKVEMGMVCEEM